MFRLLKQWLKGKLFTIEEIACEEAAVAVQRGGSDPERLEFWTGIQIMLESPSGMAWQALMQREFERLQGNLLIAATDEERKELLFRWKQQAFVTTYPSKVRAKVKDFQEKIRNQ